MLPVAVRRAIKYSEIARINPNKESRIKAARRLCNLCKPLIDKQRDLLVDKRITIKFGKEEPTNKSHELVTNITGIKKEEIAYIKEKRGEIEKIFREIDQILLFGNYKDARSEVVGILYKGVFRSSMLDDRISECLRRAQIDSNFIDTRNEAGMALQILLECDIDKPTYQKSGDVRAILTAVYDLLDLSERTSQWRKFLRRDISRVGRHGQPDALISTINSLTLAADYESLASVIMRSENIKLKLRAAMALAYLIKVGQLRDKTDMEFDSTNSQSFNRLMSEWFVGLCTINTLSLGYPWTFVPREINKKINVPKATEWIRYASVRSRNLEVLTFLISMMSDFRDAEGLLQTAAYSKIKEAREMAIKALSEGKMGDEQSLKKLISISNFGDSAMSALAELVKPYCVTLALKILNIKQENLESNEEILDRICEKFEGKGRLLTQEEREQQLKLLKNIRSPDKQIILEIEKFVTQEEAKNCLDVVKGIRWPSPKVKVVIQQLRCQLEEIVSKG